MYGASYQYVEHLISPKSKSIDAVLISSLHTMAHNLNLSGGFRLNLDKLLEERGPGIASKRFQIS